MTADQLSAIMAEIDVEQQAFERGSKRFDLIMKRSHRLDWVVTPLVIAVGCAYAGYSRSALDDRGVRSLGYLRLGDSAGLQFTASR